MLNRRLSNFDSRGPRRLASDKRKQITPCKKYRAASTRRTTEAGLRQAEANHPLQEIPRGVDQEAHGGRPPSGGGRRSLAQIPRGVDQEADGGGPPTGGGQPSLTKIPCGVDQEADGGWPPTGGGRRSHAQKNPRGVDQEAHGGWPPTGGGRSSLAKNTMRCRSKGRRGPASDRRRPTIPCKKCHAASTKRPTEAGLRQAEANHPCQNIPCGRDGGQRRLGTL